ncbi:hypothetical protein vseg_006530 [Gypsophila vaccaria]
MAEQITFMQPHHDYEHFQIQSTSQIDGQIHSQEQLQHDLLLPSCVKEGSMYKNRLQEFAQRANLQLPSYHTVTEQEPRQSPKFKSTVEVDGEKYTSTNTFSTRKAAEQDVAKIALEAISQKIKNCVSKNTTDEGFPPIHEDRVFSKSILHEFAAKKNFEKPTYDTVRLESAFPLFVSSLVFDGVKYTGEPSVNKKEAEQLAARAVILSVLAKSGVETMLSEIVKSKAKLISAVQNQYNPNTSVSYLPNSGSNGETSAIKEITFDKVQEMVDTTGNVMSDEHQQECASKKVRMPDDANESTKSIVDTLPQSSSFLTHQTLPQPSLLPRYQALPQPSLLSSIQTSMQPSTLPNSQTISRPSLLPITQTVPQPSMLPNTQTPSPPNLVPVLQTLPQPSLLQNSQTSCQPSSLPNDQIPQPSLLPNSETLYQPICLPTPQTHSQPSLLPNSQTVNQPTWLLSTQTHLQPSLIPKSEILPQPRLPASSHALSQPSSLLSSHTFPQSNSLPVTSAPSVDVQIPSTESASSRKRKNKKANKKARIQMQLSNMPPSQVPSCTVSQ